MRHRRLTIPPRLGYGNRTVGPIPPNSTLSMRSPCCSLRRMSRADVDESLLHGTDGYRGRGLAGQHYHPAGRHADGDCQSVYLACGCENVRDIETREFCLHMSVVKTWSAMGIQAVTGDNLAMASSLGRLVGSAKVDSRSSLDALVAEKGLHNYPRRAARYHECRADRKCKGMLV